MSRITGTDAANLIEAYNAVYAPQEEVELTEEQVQEDFENWVNSLVEEGYDLSEYTWEDMYEAYIGEDIKSFADRGGLLGAAQRAFARSGTEQGKAQNRAAVGRFFGGINQAMVNRIKQNVPQTTTAKPTPTAPAQQNLRGLDIGSGGFRINGRPVQTTPVRPSATTPVRPAAAPAATTPVSPRLAAPAARPAGGDMNKPAAPVKTTVDGSAAGKPAAAPAAAPARTFNPLMQRTFGYQTGNAPSQIAAASAGKPVPSGTALGSAANPQVRAALNLPAKPSLAASAPRPVPVAAPATTLTAPKPPAKKQLTPTQMRQGISASFDPFDVVMGYLIDEGYAETEQAAAVIMANMSEEWRQSIVEAVVGGSAPQAPAPIAKFVDELPNMVQNVLKGRQSSSAKPSPKKSK